MEEAAKIEKPQSGCGEVLERECRAERRRFVVRVKTIEW